MDGAAPEVLPTVFIVDDDASVRDSLLGLMRSVDLAARAFASVQAFVDAGLCGEPGCLILDVRLPGRSGLEFQRELARDGHERPIVFITGHGDIPMSVAAMKAGAVEFLAKPFRDQDLLDAVHRALAIDAARRAAAAARAVLAERVAALSPREREVMLMVAAGRLNKQIAAALGLSEITVKAHRAQVMRKMQAETLPDLVRIVDRLAEDRRS